MSRRTRSESNYFLAVRITDDEIKQRLENVRKRMIEFDPNYKNITTSTDCLHLTIALLLIQDSSQLQVVAKAMKEVSLLLKSKNNGAGSRSVIRLSGLSTFGDKVLYANVDCPRDFHVMRSAILAHLDASGVKIVDQNFNPHVTLARVTKASSCQEVGSVDPRSYMEDKSRVFGSQDVSEVCLCRMGRERQKDGFYITEACLAV